MLNLLKKLNSLHKKIHDISSIDIVGHITSANGIVLECCGLAQHVSIGSQCEIYKQDTGINHKIDNVVLAEVVALHQHNVILMPYGSIDGIAIGARVVVTNARNAVMPDESWLGRVINGFAEPLDKHGPMKNGDTLLSLKSEAPNPQDRHKIGDKIDLGVKGINCFASCCKGQRMGIFAGSGVGKSVLISMLTKYAHADVKIIGLIGERGREVKEFIDEYLGEEGLKKAIVVVATGNESALLRKRAAYLTMTIAEYFRNTGANVLCIIDSVTRFAMAQREIGLAVGEPPTTKGYTPSVFAELPKLLERAGPGVNEGNITGLFTVLVDGDDNNEPISDAVRSILDGHIVLDRNIAERGRYPAINVLKSVSRALPRCNSERENRILSYSKEILSLYEDMADMIRLGAYKMGNDKNVDLAIKYYPLIEDFLKQAPNAPEAIEESFNKLANILEIA